MKKSFTLIELLVVIAIIAILAAILLPALGKARDKAQNIDCVSRQKQLALNFLMYADENDGSFLSTMPAGYATTWGYYYSQAEVPGFAPKGKHDDWARKFGMCPLVASRYIKNGKLPGITSTYGIPYGQGPLTIAGNANRGAMIPVKQVKEPANSVLIAESYYPAWQSPHPNIYGGKSAAWANFATLHGKTGNIGFMDGHVETLDPFTAKGRNIIVPRFSGNPGEWRPTEKLTSAYTVSGDFLTGTYYAM